MLSNAPPLFLIHHINKYRKYNWIQWPYNHTKSWILSVHKKFYSQKAVIRKSGIYLLSKSSVHKKYIERITIKKFIKDSFRPEIFPLCTQTVICIDFIICHNSLTLFSLPLSFSDDVIAFSNMQPWHKSWLKERE